MLVPEASNPVLSVIVCREQNRPSAVGCIRSRKCIQKALLYRCSFASMLARSGKVDVDARKVERCRMADAGRELEVEPS